jgi:hypothetical protein
MTACKLLKQLVGASGFEPEASCAQGRRATRLRYAPTGDCFIHSKALPNFAPNPCHRFYPRLCTNCARMGHCTVTVHIGAAIRASAATGAISLARRLSFTSASRFICNFICEYFLKTCASLWRSI